MKADLMRLIGVSAAFVLCIAGSAVGSGAFGGTPINEAAGGALAADATLLAPAGAAFSIWGVIYAGLGAYTVYQWAPSQRSSDRQRRLGWWVAASMVLNAAWILSVQAGLLAGSVLVILALLLVLAVVFAIFTSVKPTSAVDGLITDGTLGLYLGWVCVAACANITAALTSAGFGGFGLAPESWALTVLAVVVLVGVLLALRSNGRLAIAAAIGWGLLWIAVGRASGAPESTTTAIAAASAAALIAVVTVAVRARRRSHPGSHAALTAA